MQACYACPCHCCHRCQAGPSQLFTLSQDRVGVETMTARDVEDNFDALMQMIPFIEGGRSPKKEVLAKAVHALDEQSGFKLSDMASAAKVYYASEASAFIIAATVQVFLPCKCDIALNCSSSCRHSLSHPICPARLISCTSSLATSSSSAGDLRGRGA